MRAAAAAGVAVGAHPSFPDRQNFGRQAMALPAEAIHDLVLYQIGALEIFCRQEGVRLQHVKPHGALYHLAPGSPKPAQAIARAVRAAGRDLILVGPPGSALATAAADQRPALRRRDVRRPAIRRGRAAAAAQSDPRALIALDHAAAGARAVQMVPQRPAWPPPRGRRWPTPATPSACTAMRPTPPARARAVRAALEAAGIRVAPLGAWL